MSSDFDFGPFDPDDVVAAEAPPSMSGGTTLLDSAVASFSVDVLSGELDFNLDLDDEDPSSSLTGGVCYGNSENDDVDKAESGGEGVGVSGGVLLVDPAVLKGRMMCRGAIGNDGFKFCTKDGECRVASHNVKGVNT